MITYNFLIHKEVEYSIDFAKVFEVVNKDNPGLLEAFDKGAIVEVFGDNIYHYLNNKMGMNLPEDDEWNQSVYDSIVNDFGQWVEENIK